MGLIENPIGDTSLVTLTSITQTSVIVDVWERGIAVIGRNVDQTATIGIEVRVWFGIHADMLSAVADGGLYLAGQQVIDARTKEDNQDPHDNYLIDGSHANRFTSVADGNQNLLARARGTRLARCKRHARGKQKRADPFRIHPFVQAPQP